jgi:inactivated superfamily I helicase
MKTSLKISVACLLTALVAAPLGGWFALETWYPLQSQFNAIRHSEQLKMLRQQNYAAAEKFTSELLETAVAGSKPATLAGFVLPVPASHDATFLREKLKRDREADGSIKKMSDASSVTQ